MIIFISRFHTLNQKIWMRFLISISSILNLIINGCLKFVVFLNKDLMNQYKVADKSPEQAWRDALNKNRNHKKINNTINLNHYFHNILLNKYTS